ncbi:MULTISPECIES: FtsX-like permease family protein [unclassified Streptomyces]|uniref:FtsX-like permease family protein n=1 Tax=unclassified Streptomyces TaxID=2593676 RepID=UPI003D73EC01
MLRLAGATGWQVLRLVSAEALTVVAAGTLLGLAVAGLGLAGLCGALALVSAPVTPALPWATITTAAGACAFLAVLSTVVPTALTLRRRAVELAGVRE